jgi:hypothetical protein
MNVIDCAFCAAFTGGATIAGMSAKANAITNRLFEVPYCIESSFPG